MYNNMVVSSLLFTFLSLINLKVSIILPNCFYMNVEGFMSPLIADPNSNYYLNPFIWVICLYQISNHFYSFIISLFLFYF